MPRSVRLVGWMRKERGLVGSGAVGGMMAQVFFKTIEC